ncbi:putative queuine tRNA-ribosyltransferase [Neospora caninum Liverpool]|uniref:Putative queuine tRNA-ribosyltransferase n=1 Tax=Neospora caninum (strain Liverpool) TaxID=572307 RepID=F0VA07_NEOCL|nr:putative queuine tRNA-ribosyltransferase [Neospora caninum Liverpool]CBZ50496.1 putative queuine tRNA-ribosyltransferase [Neospora caninum Liverpool]|eukprot:XP_003880529.1 putative queuine tRNA-ribosyltransferase [Neospora caninum Liverpool]
MGTQPPDVILREPGNTQSGSPRVGVIRTLFGDVETPNFILCGTKASVKGVTVEMLREANTQIILANTYHLLVYPGPEVIERLGGLQHFTGWRGPMFTDSGGYQIFSLHHGSVADEVKGRRRGTGSRAPSSSSAGARESSEGGRDGRECIERSRERLGDAPLEAQDTGEPDSQLLRLDETGAIFRSYHTGQRVELTPERAMEAQTQLGADLIVALDECTPFHASKGGVYRDLRQESVSFVNEHPFFGSAIGGSLGADSEQMHAVVQETARQLRKDRPIHLLGIGRMRDIFHGVKQGIDTFDCVHPTRAGRHGSALVPRAFWEGDGAVGVPPSACWDHDDSSVETRGSAERPDLRAGSVPELASSMSSPSTAFLTGRPKRKKAFPVAAQTPKEYVDLRNAAFKFDDRPILHDCGCYTCRTASRAYLHYLLKAGEQLGGVLVTVHNIYTMNRLMGCISPVPRESSPGATANAHT